MALNIPAEVGMPLAEVDTPCLLVDLDAIEHNIERMARVAAEHGVRLRAHAKSHKSPDIAARQIAAGAVGVCCQKVSEAETMVRGGVRDVLISNEVVNPRMLARLAALAATARVIVCVDDADNIAALEAAAAHCGTTVEVLVEIDVGAGRCGVAPGAPACALARAIAAAPHLRFSGLQAYHGPAQHVRAFGDREALIERAIAATRDTVAQLAAQGLDCDIVGGAGSGTYRLEAASGVYNELQCGSYVFMDADYQRIVMADGRPTDDFRNSLFLYTTVMSKTKADKAICDAGLKSHSVDSGLPVVFGRDDIEYIGASDEHGELGDPHDRLVLGDRLMLIPGHCDPTVNLHDWLVGIRGDRVETLWPVAARGMSL
ncbi:DSD1 family PLP-dependent enzyme [Salinisphaera aquimarina]|uniref:DSD1 family PLP-dependent enzyme n=1 Tax=Salinisphaera aquimarina TaxID=2094031 RepID=A0ABV7ENZ3_9GAMM